MTAKQFQEYLGHPPPGAFRGISFKDYMKLVDHHLNQLCGLSHRDLPDQNWFDFYEDEIEPSEAVSEVLEEEGGL